MLVGLLGILRSRNHAIVVPSLLLIVGLQYYDTELLRKSIHAVATRPTRVHHSEWEKLIQSVDRVNLYPTLGGGRSLGSTVFFQGITTKYGRPLNTAYLAREQENCIAKQAIFQKPLMAKNLYVVSEGDVPSSIIDAINHDWCRSGISITSGIFSVPNDNWYQGSDKWIICIPGSNSQWWCKHGPTFQKLDVLH